MKKKMLMALSAACLLMTGCGTMGSADGTNGSLLGSVLGAITNGNAVGNVIASVIGLDKLTQERLVGTWRYTNPGCAFTSESLLAKAGGEVAATQIEEKLKPQFDAIGISTSNTYLTFTADNKFEGAIAGKSVSGTYTFNASTSQLTLKTLLFSLNGYATGTISGISVLFEGNKLLTLVQTLSALSGNATLQTVGEISKSYDGVRLGFDMSR